MAKERPERKTAQAKGTSEKGQGSDGNYLTSTQDVVRALDTVPADVEPPVVRVPARARHAAVGETRTGTQGDVLDIQMLAGLHVVESLHYLTLIERYALDLPFRQLDSRGLLELLVSLFSVAGTDDVWPALERITIIHRDNVVEDVVRPLPAALGIVLLAELPLHLLEDCLVRRLVVNGDDWQNPVKALLQSRNWKCGQVRAVEAQELAIDFEAELFEDIGRVKTQLVNDPKKPRLLVRMAQVSLKAILVGITRIHALEISLGMIDLFSIRGNFTHVGYFLLAFSRLR